MASRYPLSKSVDYCFHPVHVVDDDKDIIVPCGKCDGCLLHKANEWSMRCVMEIEDTPCTIFGTLTYDNKYLPKLYPVVGTEFLSYQYIDKYNFAKRFDNVVWVSDHPENIRFNSVCDVPRRDGIIISHNYLPIDIKHWDNFDRPAINYASKRDVQLWLKLLRKDLYEQGFKNQRNEQGGLFRYYIISEVGPTTLRSHFHFLLFCCSVEVASYLSECSIYKNWKMCDEDRLTPYLRYCSSGAAGYVTQYLTCNSLLPEVYRENKEIRPFRVASKSPSIGFVSQNKEEIFENVSRGIIFYSRKIYRLESNSLLEYPSGYTATLFPKCYRFNKISDRGRFFVYNFLFRSVRKFGFSNTLLLRGLFKVWHTQDVLATVACYRFCCEIEPSPEYYYYLLDMYYYQVAMSHLRQFYMAQENIDFSEDKIRIFEFYSNIEILCVDYEKYQVDIRAFDSVVCLGYDLIDMLSNKDFFRRVRSELRQRNLSYINEVYDIKRNMVKMPTFNELTGVAPTIV